MCNANLRRKPSTMNRDYDPAMLPGRSRCAGHLVQSGFTAGGPSAANLRDSSDFMVTWRDRSVILVNFADGPVLLSRFINNQTS